MVVTVHEEYRSNAAIDMNFIKSKFRNIVKKVFAAEGEGSLLAI